MFLLDSQRVAFDMYAEHVVFIGLVFTTGYVLKLLSPRAWRVGPDILISIHGSACGWILPFLKPEKFRIG